MKLLEENLIWLCTRNKGARNRGVAIDCLYAHKEIGLTLDNRSMKYSLIYEGGMFHVRSYATRHKHSTFYGVSWTKERVPNSYNTGPRAYPDGRVYKNSFRTEDQPKGSFMCGWALKPSVLSSMRGNKNLSMHERMKLEITFDLIQRLSRVPKHLDEAAQAAERRQDSESAFTTI